MDKVYVVYLDGEMYKSHSRKTAYLEERYARQIISVDSKRIAEYGKKGWYDLSKKEKQEHIDGIKARFEIREFVDENIKKEEDL
jgi:hypothetical protein